MSHSLPPHRCCLAEGWSRLLARVGEGSGGHTAHREECCHPAFGHQEEWKPSAPALLQEVIFDNVMHPMYCSRAWNIGHPCIIQDADKGMHAACHQSKA